jgi:hypothetical protein
MAEQAHVTRRDIEARLITRAWKDEAFAAELRHNPRAAVAAELTRLGIKATLDRVDVKVLEETRTTSGVSATAAAATTTRTIE